MTRKIFVSLLLLSLGATAFAQKKRVTVMDFDYATVQSWIQQLYGSNQDVGKGIADLLVDKLVESGVYSVIERKQLDKILAEQNFSNSDRADPNSAAKIGRILGVNAMIVGSITQFGRDDKSTNIGGIGRVTDRFGIGGVSKKESTAVVQITARMIDVNTAEILASATSKNESSRKGASLIGSGGSAAGMAGGVLDMRSSNFANTILGEAVTKTVADLAHQLDAKAGSMPTSKVEVSGLVADAAPDGTVTINVGSKNGVRVGDVLQIKRKGRTITDPATGKALRSIDEPVGTIKITEVQDSFAVGKFSGAGTPKVSDVVSSQ